MTIYGRALILKATGALIEFQSDDAPLGTLTENAIAAGYAAQDIEEKYVTKAEYDTLIAAIPAPTIIEPLKDEIASLTTQDLTNVDKIKAILEGLRSGAHVL